MTSPTTTAALPLANLIDDLVGNASGETVRISLNRLAAVIAAVMGPTYATRAQLYADKAWPAGSVGYVRADATTAYNGIYKKSGAVGAGNWARIGDLPGGAVEAALINDLRNYVDEEMAAEATARADADTALAAILPQMSATADVIPLITAGDQVVLWLDDQGVGGPGLRPPAPVAPLATDGRSLHRLRAKQAAIRRGVEGAQMHIAVTGDSWAEINTIPYALRAALEAAYGIAGEGYQTTSRYQRPSAVTLEYSEGWTSVDASETSDFAYGLGADGKAIWTSSNAATLSLSEVRATRIEVFYRHHGGTWRWRVDDGTWTVVTSDGSGGFGVLDIAGLTDAVHRLEIDTVGNTGVVSLVGFYSTTEGTGGQMSRLGNSGLTGWRLQAVTPYIQDVAARITPDAVVVVLGTNDYREYRSPPQVYIAALAALADAYRAAVPDVGLIFVLPPQTSTAANAQAQPLADYRDALYAFCTANGYEFLNLLDQFGSYDQGSAHGLWADYSHVNTTGARLVIDTLNNAFLHL